MMFIRKLFNLKFDFLVVGDDVLIVIDITNILKLRQALLYIYVDADKEGFDQFEYEKHGLGILMRDFKVSRNIGSFLSKLIIYHENQVTIMRDPYRACLSANVSAKMNSKIKKKDRITWPEFNTCISIQLME